MALWDLIGTVKKGESNTASVSATFDASPGIIPGSLLIAEAHANAEHDGPPEGWSVVRSSSDPGSNGNWVAFYYKIATGDESLTVTVTATGASRSRLYIKQRSTEGLAVSYYDSRQNFQSSNVTSWTSTPMDAPAGALSEVFVGLHNNAGTWGTFSNSYTTEGTHTGSGANPASASGSKVLASGGTETTTITWTTGRSYNGIHALFVAEGAEDPIEEAEASVAFDLSVEAEAEEPPVTHGLQIERISATEASVTYVENPDADRYIIERRTPPDGIPTVYDPAANPQTVEVSDGDEIRVGAVIKPLQTLSSLDDPTWDTAVHKVPQGFREIVRTSDGTLWLVNQVNEAPGTDVITVWRWSGTQWEPQDWSNGPRGVNTVDPLFNSIGVVVDDSDVLHIIAPSGGNNIVYVRFNPATLEFEGQEQIEFTLASFGELSSSDLAIDSDGDLHLCATAFDDSGVNYELFYARRAVMSGTWDITRVAGPSGNMFHPPSITVDPQGRPIIAYVQAGFLNVARIGVSTEIKAVAASDDTFLLGFGRYQSPVVFNGDVWVAYVRPDSTLGLVRHDSAEDWDTWDTPVTNGQDAASVSAAVHDGKIYVLYLNEDHAAGGLPNSVDMTLALDAYDGSWAGQTVVASDARATRGVLRWQSFHLASPEVLELTYWNGTKPVYLPIDASSETIIWSPWIEVPPFGGSDPVEEATASLNFDLGITAEAVTPAASVQQADAQVDFSLGVTADAITPTATVEEAQAQVGFDFEVTATAETPTPGTDNATASVAFVLGVSAEAQTPTASVEQAEASLGLTLSVTSTAETPQPGVPSATASVAFDLGISAEASTPTASIPQAEAAVALSLSVTASATSPRTDLSDYTVFVGAPTERPPVLVQGIVDRVLVSEPTDRVVMGEPELRSPAITTVVEIRDAVRTEFLTDRWKIGEPEDRWAISEPIIDRGA